MENSIHFMTAIIKYLQFVCIYEFYEFIDFRSTDITTKKNNFFFIYEINQKKKK